MRMAKKTKTSTARETVYDRCAYVGCYNGKFINGRKLFHFPAETDRRLEMWIERSGNFRLRTWAATSLRKAGLCADHFDERSFTNGTRKALRRNVVPRHYTEDFKYRQANGGDPENVLEMLGAKDMEEPVSLEATSSPEEVACSRKIPRGSEEDDELSGLEKWKEKSRSSSPLVEFIVEELDEALILRGSGLLVGGTEGEAIDSEDEARGSEKGDGEDCGDVESENEAPEAEMSDSVMSFDASDAEETPRARETSTDVNGPEGVEKRENLRGPEHREPQEEISLPEKRTCCPYNDLCSNLGHEKALRSLRNENETLRRKMRFLKRNLGRSRGRKKNFDTSKSIDDFLDTQECANPATRALIKLSLHKPNCPFTEEEKKLAIQLYRNSLETFMNLRRTGCNLPHENAIKRWIREESYGDIIDDVAPTNELDEVDDFSAEAVLIENENNCHANGTSQDSLTFDQMETEILYMPETIDGVEQVLESPEVPESRPEGERNDKEFFVPVNVAHKTFS